MPSDDKIVHHRAFSGVNMCSLPSLEASVDDFDNVKTRTRCSPQDPANFRCRQKPNVEQSMSYTSKEMQTEGRLTTPIGKPLNLGKPMLIMEGVADDARGRQPLMICTICVCHAQLFAQRT